MEKRVTTPCSNTQHGTEPSHSSSLPLLKGNMSPTDMELNPIIPLVGGKMTLLPPSHSNYASLPPRNCPQEPPRQHHLLMTSPSFSCSRECLQISVNLRREKSDYKHSTSWAFADSIVLHDSWSWRSPACCPAVTYCHQCPSSCRWQGPAEMPRAELASPLPTDRRPPWQASNTLGRDVVEDNLAKFWLYRDESNTLQQHQILLQRFPS